MRPGLEVAGLRRAFWDPPRGAELLGSPFLPDATAGITSVSSKSEFEV